MGLVLRKSCQYTSLVWTSVRPLLMWYSTLSSELVVFISLHTGPLKHDCTFWHREQTPVSVQCKTLYSRLKLLWGCNCIPRFFSPSWNSPFSQNAAMEQSDIFWFSNVRLLQGLQTLCTTKTPTCILRSASAELHIWILHIRGTVNDIKLALSVDCFRATKERCNGYAAFMTLL